MPPKAELGVGREHDQTRAPRKALALDRAQERIEDARARSEIPIRSFASHSERNSFPLADPAFRGPARVRQDLQA
jgi:hypothetical protein